MELQSDLPATIQEAADNPAHTPARTTPTASKYSYCPLTGEDSIRLVEVLPGSPGDEVHCWIIDRLATVDLSL